MRGWTIAALAVVLNLQIGIGPAKAAEPVDLALVLAVDCSFSVSEDEYHFQLQAIADALRSKDVASEISSGSNGGIAVVMMEWAGEGEQKAATPWTRLASASDIEAYAEALTHAPRYETGYTSISGAIAGGLTLLTHAPFVAGRRVIDISTDGDNNDGPRPEVVRDRAARLGVTINGLAITHNLPYLDLYFQHHVIAGPGSFVLKADDDAAFHAAMKRKLLLEIQPVS